MRKFYGRKRELKMLGELIDQRSASLVVIKGRRRIGKSRLAEKFSESFKRHYTFVGLPPEEKVTADIERRHFANDLEKQTELKGLRADDWDFLFHNLAQFTKEGPVLIIFDEINWMGTKDPAFLGKLKTAWDVYFKHNPQLIMILSGSMSGWIEKNILSSTGFFGRVTLDITLKELSLHECHHFWQPFKDKISSYEKFKLLCVTGGVPLYLEAIQPNISAEENIRRLFYRKEGLCFLEFDQIFSDLFSKRSATYKKIVEFLTRGPAEQQKICEQLKIGTSGFISEYLNDLVKSDYISRDHTWNLKNGKISKLSRYRLSDNYLRFYLKHIEPYKENVLHDRGDLPLNWYSILGLQFENLVLNNRANLFSLLGIQKNEIEIDNPYFQTKTKRHRGVQIDYMIQTRFNNLYLCEIKFRRDKIGMNVIDEMKDKLKRLVLPKEFSFRTVLIHVNGVTDELLETNYFTHILDFTQLLECS